jgi:predicted AlkP superfamily phosphohydrolase/phosphomutase
LSVRTKTKRILIIGADGASPSLIAKWKDELPNISNLMDNGAWGNLRSTVPPTTLPAWASFASGKTPESLGFFGFQKVEFNPRRTRFVQSNDWAPAIWDVFSKNHLKVGVINFPGTYPPRKVKGFMISGFLSPSSARIFYPASLKKVVQRTTEKYRVYPDLNPYMSGEQRFIDDVYEVFRERLRVTEYLIQEYKWNLFVVVFMLLDWIQHYFWKHMDPEHPLHQSGNPYRDTIKRSYKLVDSAIGRLTEAVEENTHIMVLSDHGFGRLQGSFRVNSWLYQKGYLHRKNGFENVGVTRVLKSGTAKDLLRRLNLDVASIGKRIKYRKVFEKILPDDATDDPFTQNISKIDVDWEKTKAFGFGHYNEIYVNLKERGGCVDSKDYWPLIEEITGDLENLGKESGVRFQVFTRRTFSKRSIEYGPDITYFINDGEYVQSNRFNPHSLWEASKEKSGEHRLQGIWVLKGHGVKRVSNKQARICDFAPTVYYLFGLKPPPDTDGTVLSEILE